MRWWQIRLPVAALAALCLALVAISPGEGAQPRRPKATWAPSLEQDSCSEVQRALSQFRVCLEIAPGETRTETVTVTATEEVRKPRIVRQTANGAIVISARATSAIPDPLPAGQSVDVEIVLAAPPGLRARNVSGRLYLADRQSVLTAPLNIRVKINHPTPEQVAQTPVVVPTNHVQLVKRAPLAIKTRDSARFNIRHLVVRSGTTLTWTNNAGIVEEGAASARAVKGTLCDPTKPLSPTRKCDFDPAAVAQCALTVDPVASEVITDTDGRMLCFISPSLPVQGYYSLLMTRPLTRQPLTYYMEEPLHDEETMVEEIEINNVGVKYYPYLTIK